VQPDAQIQSLQDYLQIARFIVPDDEEMNSPTIRHPDLAPNDIIIADNGDIVGMIDWQHCSILSLFLQARIPSHFPGISDDEFEKFSPPKLPDDFVSV
jgi:hypothetical protein